MDIVCIVDTDVMKHTHTKPKKKKPKPKHHTKKTIPKHLYDPRNLGIYKLLNPFLTDHSGFDTQKTKHLSYLF